ncbi:hypothetical protein AC579_337 [Pseudocercospora musae]|uniref:Uncharacterized protein n=1 Tax=Pseudocercospora musae TaxID=113226 RepID=A0A139IR20_9PEZI|nr:hypothetical protein AC579_337 [Pseudocercospora musae]
MSHRMEMNKKTSVWDQPSRLKDAGVSPCYRHSRKCKLRTAPGIIAPSNHKLRVVTHPLWRQSHLPLDRWSHALQSFLNLRISSIPPLHGNALLLRDYLTVQADLAVRRIISTSIALQGPAYPIARSSVSTGRSAFDQQFSYLFFNNPAKGPLFGPGLINAHDQMPSPAPVILNLNLNLNLNPNPKALVSTLLFRPPPPTARFATEQSTGDGRSWGAGRLQTAQTHNQLGISCTHATCLTSRTLRQPPFSHLCIALQNPPTLKRNEGSMPPAMAIGSLDMLRGRRLWRQRPFDRAAASPELSATNAVCHFEPPPVSDEAFA